MLFNWTWYMGMLRGIDEHELIVSLEYQGKGTVQVDGQPCTLTKYRVSTNYQTPGQRIQYTCTRANGQTSFDHRGRQRSVRLERRHRGRRDHCRERQGHADGGRGRRSGSSACGQVPQGAPKAALTGVSETAESGANPRRLCRTASRRRARRSLTWEAGKPVVTFPIPGVPARPRRPRSTRSTWPRRVVVKQGSTTTEFTYGDYQDWNNPLNKIDALYAGKMTERRNGTVVRDLTTTETETGSVYVVMPVPASVKKAITVAVPAPPTVPLPVRRRHVGAGRADQTDAAAWPTANPT